MTPVGTQSISLGTPAVRHRRVPTRQGQGYFIRTFGCQMNEHDSERIAGLLEADGMVPVDRPERADVVVLNTCTIRENADERLRGYLGALRSLKSDRAGMQIAVGGCMAQKDGDTIRARADWVDVVFGTHNTHRVVDLLDHAAEWGPVTEILDETRSVDDLPSMLPAHRRSPHTAWVTITIGCNNSCTFCIVPAVRGREISRRPGDILGEVRQLAEAGVTEVTLLGQNVNSYGRDLEINGRRPLFADLLRQVGSVDGIRRVRYTSPHPKDFRQDVADAMAETPAVCEHLHLPLQSGSDRVLAAMHRGYTGARFLDKLAMAHRTIPDLTVTTDIIVGFPGETEADFAATLDVVGAARFDSAFTFQFSPRPGTPAATMERPDPQAGHPGTVRPAGGAAGRDLPGAQPPAAGPAARGDGRGTVAEGPHGGHHPDPGRVAAPRRHQAPARCLPRGRGDPGGAAPPPREPATLTLLAVVGPTASGKSDVAMRLAEERGADIVSVDSMQVYRGMDIGTAKPDAGDRDRVRHHLLDLVEPEVEFTVADYQAAGVDVLDRLASAGRPAILVGGSGLHFRSLVDPIHPAPTDPELRAELEAASVDDLVDELRRHDPHAGAVLDLANPRRVVRAVEVLRLTGATPTQRAGATPDLVGYRPARPFVAVGLDPGDSLASRVDRRLEAMVDAGLLDEVRRLRHRLGRTARQAVGYRQLLAVVDGAASVEDGVAAARRATVALARRQRTFFRRDPRIRWVPWHDDISVRVDRSRALLDGEPAWTS